MPKINNDVATIQKWLNNGGDLSKLLNNYDSLSDEEKSIQQIIEKIKNLDNNKVEKDGNKGLSTKDFTDDLLKKLEGIEFGATKTIVDDELKSSSSNPVANSAVKEALDRKVEKIDAVGQKTEGGGEIFNDYENNKAISPNSHTEGKNNLAGSKCFRFDTGHIYDESHAFENGSGTYYLTSVEGIEIGFVYTVVLNANYDYNGIVEGISEEGNCILVSNYQMPSSVEKDSNWLTENSYILFPDHPELGTDVIGEGAHAGGQETQAIADLTMTRGYKTKATGNKATALGEVTKASGENALAHGQMPTEVLEGQTPKKGAAGKNSRTGGYNNEATGLNTEATGDGNSAQADNSFVINYANTAVFDKEKNINAKNSFVGGEGNFAKRKNQTILGEFAVENNPDSLFVIGNGSNWNRGLRSNALDVRKNGQIIAKAKPNSNESLTNKKYVDDSIQNEILDKFDRQDASFIFNNKRYYLTDIYRDDGYCIFSDETEMTNVRFHISQKIDNIPDIIIKMNYQYKKLFSDFNENYFTYSKYMIGTNDDDDYKYWSVSPYSIPTVDEVKSFFKYNNIELSKLEKIWIRSLFYYNNNPYIRFSKPQGNWGNIHLVVEGEYDTTGSVYSTTRTEDTYHCPVYMFMTYINRSFFLENHLNVYFMGTKFKELLSNMFTREELSNIYSENELDIIFGIIIDQEYDSKSKNAQSGIAVAQAIAQLLGSAPENLDTLEELANALQNDESFANKIIDMISGKVDKVDGYGLSKNNFTDLDKRNLEFHDNVVREYEQTRANVRKHFMYDTHFNITEDDSAEVESISQLSKYIEEIGEYIPYTAKLKDTKAREELESKANVITGISSGENINIKDSADARFRGLKLYGKSKQNQYKGNNLFNNDTSLIKIISFKSSETSNESFRAGYEIELPPGKYTAKAYFKDGPRTDTSEKLYLYGVIVDENNVVAVASTKLSLLTTNNNGVDVFNTRTFEIQEGQKLRYYDGPDYRNNNDSLNHAKNTLFPILNIQIEKGETATEYEPYTGGKPSPSPEYPQEIINLNEINLNVVNKNFIPYPYRNTTKELYGVTCIDNGDGSITLNGKYTHTTYADFILVKNLNIPAGTYTLSGCPSGGKNETYRMISTITQADGTTTYKSETGNGYTFEVVEGATISIYIRIGAGLGTVSNLTFKPMLELSPTATEYLLHKKQTLIVPDDYNGIPVSKNGNYTDEKGQQWICDEIDFARGKYVQRIYKKTLTGTESWKVSTVQANLAEGFIRYDASFTSPLPYSKDSLWTHFPFRENQGGYGYGAWVLNESPRTSIRIITDHATVDDLKAWLADKATSEEPVTVLYILAEPIETPLTEEQIFAYKALQTYKPITNIYTLEGAGIEVDYVADTKAYIDNKFTELQNAIISMGGNI